MKVSYTVESYFLRESQSQAYYGDIPGAAWVQCIGRKPLTCWKRWPRAPVPLWPVDEGKISIKELAVFDFFLPILNFILTLDRTSERNFVDYFWIFCKSHQPGNFFNRSTHISQPPKWLEKGSSLRTQAASSVLKESVDSLTEAMVCKLREFPLEPRRFSWSMDLRELILVVIVFPGKGGHDPRFIMALCIEHGYTCIDWIW